MNSMQSIWKTGKMQARHAVIVLSKLLLPFHTTEQQELTSFRAAHFPDPLYGIHGRALRIYMLKALRSLPLVCLLLSSFVFASQPSSAPSGLLTFETNHGQTAPQVRYLARSREGILFFTPDGLTVAVPHQGSFRLLI